MTNPQDREPSPTFCVLPFTHVATTVDGVWGRCCFDVTNDYEHYYKQAQRPPMTLAPDALGCAPGSEYAADNPERVFSLREAFNSPNLRATRLAMLDGQEVNACHLCHERDRHNLPSPRTDANDAYTPEELQHFAAAVHADGTITDEPTSLDLRLGNSCNLQCTMCDFPASSAITATTGTWVRKTIDPHSNDPQFWRDMDTVAPHLTRIYFAGGEPLLQPAHPRLLRMLIDSGHASHIRLHYNSNLTILRDNVLQQLTHFNTVTIAASCDGTAETFETIRRGASWDTFVHNVRRARALVTVYLDCTVQNGNIAHLADLIAFADNENIDLRLENYVDYPSDLSVRNLPEDLKTEHTMTLTRLHDEATATAHTQRAQHLRRLLDYLNSPPLHPAT